MKKTIEKALEDIRSLRNRMEQMAQDILSIESNLDALAASLPDEPNTF